MKFKLRTSSQKTLVRKITARNITSWLLARAFIYKKNQTDKSMTMLHQSKELDMAMNSENRFRPPGIANFPGTATPGLDEKKKKSFPQTPGNFEDRTPGPIGRFGLGQKPTDSEIVRAGRPESASAPFFGPRATNSFSPVAATDLSTVNPVGKAIADYGNTVSADVKQQRIVNHKDQFLKSFGGNRAPVSQPGQIPAMNISEPKVAPVQTVNSFTPPQPVTGLPLAQEQEATPPGKTSLPQFSGSTPDKNKFGLGFGPTTGASQQGSGIVEEPQPLGANLPDGSSPDTVINPQANNQPAAPVNSFKAPAKTDGYNFGTESDARTFAQLSDGKGGMKSPYGASHTFTVLRDPATGKDMVRQAVNGGHSPTGGNPDLKTPFVSAKRFATRTGWDAEGNPIYNDGSAAMAAANAGIADYNKSQISSYDARNAQWLAANGTVPKDRSQADLNDAQAALEGKRAAGYEDDRALAGRKLTADELKDRMAAENGILRSIDGLDADTQNQTLAGMYTGETEGKQTPLQQRIRGAFIQDRISSIEKDVEATKGAIYDDPLPVKNIVDKYFTGVPQSAMVDILKQIDPKYRGKIAKELRDQYDRQKAKQP